MRLLFEQNLSPGVPDRLGDIYPESTHVRTIGLATALDSIIWEFAKLHGFVITSKDSDFQQRSLLFGHPPKFIWLRVGKGRRARELRRVATRLESLPLLNLTYSKLREVLRRATPDTEAEWLRLCQKCPERDLFMSNASNG